MNQLNRLWSLFCGLSSHWSCALCWSSWWSHPRPRCRRRLCLKTLCSGRGPACLLLPWGWTSSPQESSLDDWWMFKFVTNHTFLFFIFTEVKARIWHKRVTFQPASDWQRKTWCPHIYVPVEFRLKNKEAEFLGSVGITVKVCGQWSYLAARRRKEKLH